MKIKYETPKERPGGGVLAVAAALIPLVWVLNIAVGSVVAYAAIELIANIDVNFAEAVGAGVLLAFAKS